MSKDLYALKDFLLTGITEQVKHEYETEEEFEEMYGPTDTIDEVISLLCDLKCNEDICRVYCPACLDADPQNYRHYLDLFGLDLDEVEDLDGKKYTEYITWGYDKDGDVYEEYYRGIDKDTAIEVAEKRTVFMEQGRLYRTLKNGDTEPIDWVEVVDSGAEFCDDSEYSSHVIWSSYGREEGIEK